MLKSCLTDQTVSGSGSFEVYSIIPINGGLILLFTALRGTGNTAYVLESAGIYNDKFRTAKEKASRKNIFLDAGRKKLFSFCEENGIWYMPLKGSVLKELYPDFSMRQMADNDILFDAGYQQKKNNE